MQFRWHGAQPSSFSATMQDILDDAKDGYDWVHNSLPELVGAKRIGQTVLLGWSAGAQIACMVVSTCSPSEDEADVCKRHKRHCMITHYRPLRPSCSHMEVWT